MGQARPKSIVGWDEGHSGGRQGTPELHEFGYEYERAKAVVHAAYGGPGRLPGIDVSSVRIDAATMHDCFSPVLAFINSAVTFGNCRFVVGTAPNDETGPGSVLI